MSKAVIQHVFHDSLPSNLPTYKISLLRNRIDKLIMIDLLYVN